MLVNEHGEPEMDRTARLRLPYLSASQARKHVTLNESLSALDGLVNLSAASDSAALPDPAEDGHVSIVPAGASGLGEGHERQIAHFHDGAWSFHQPKTGWRAWIEDGQRLAVFDGSDWIDVPGPEQLSRLGIATTPDNTNRLSIASPSSLFSHSGDDHRMKINKAAAGDTASLLFQTNWSGRAEFGLAGDDRFRVKVSSDGGQWTNALDIDPASGKVSFPAGLAAPSHAPNLIINPELTINQRQFSGGPLAAGQFGHDRWRAGPSETVYSVIKRSIVLQAGRLEQVVDLPLRPGESVVFSAEVSDGALSVHCLDMQAQLFASADRQAIVFTNSGDSVETVTLGLSGSATVDRMKLESGTVPTPWTARSHLEELSLCQYYFEQFGPGPGAYNPVALATAISERLVSSFYPHAVKRVIPQVSFNGAFQILGIEANSEYVTGIRSFFQTERSFEIRADLGRDVISNTAGLIRTDDDQNAFIAIDAEH
jgi:hypothetical protein